MTAGTFQGADRTAQLIEDFRGDFSQLAAVMESSWGENAGTPFLYTAEFLEECFRYPGASCAFAPSIYHGSELAAFVAGFPRQVMVGGERRKVLVVALLTVACEHKSAGYGILVWSALVRRAIEAGFDGVVNYCIEGEAMNRMIEGCCRRLRVPVMRALTFTYLSKILRGRGSANIGERSSSAEALAAAADCVADQAAVSRVWTREEAAWQLGRTGAVSARAGGDDGIAILTGYVMPIADRNRTGCLIVEDVLWGDLPAENREGLVRDLAARGAAAGARIAIVPLSGYADPSPFLAAGFRPSTKTIHAYLTLWRGTAPQSPVAGYYLDVF